MKEEIEEIVEENNKFGYVITCICIVIGEFLNLFI